MAASGGTSNRNGANSRNSLKLDKPFSPNSNPNSSLKSKSLPNSALRRSSPASLGAAKNDGGGLFFAFLLLLFLFFVLFFFFKWFMEVLSLDVYFLRSTLIGDGEEN